MKIEWNKVTWYSKFGALIVFIVVVPVLTFIIGKEYQATIEVLQNEQLPISNVQRRSVSQSSVASINSGIIGKLVMQDTCTDTNCEAQSLTAPLVIKNSKGVVVTHTVSRADGKFLLLLPPDTYRIEEVNNKKTAEVIVIPETIIPAEMEL